MASIRAQAELRHSISKYGYAETFRTVTKDNSEHRVMTLTRKAWSCKTETVGSRMIVIKLFFVYQITVK